MAAPSKIRSLHGTGGEWTGLVDTNLSRIADSDVSLTNGSDSSSSTDASPTFQDWDDELQDARCALDASQRKVLQHSSENTHEATDEQAGPSECIGAIPAQRAESLTAGNQSPVDDVLQPTAARVSTEGSPILQAPPIRRESPIRADYGVTALLVFVLCATVFLEQVTKHSSSSSPNPSPTPLFDSCPPLESKPESKHEVPVEEIAPNEWAEWEKKREAFVDSEPKWRINEPASPEWKAWAQKYCVFLGGNCKPERVPRPELDTNKRKSTVWDKWKEMFEELVDGPWV